MTQSIFCDMCELIADIMDLEGRPSVDNKYQCSHEAWVILNRMVKRKCKELMVEYDDAAERILNCVNEVMKNGIAKDIKTNHIFSTYKEIYNFFFLYD